MGGRNGEEPEENEKIDELHQISINNYVKYLSFR